MKNTMRKAMLSTIAMLVVAVMSLTGVTYAWFTSSDSATVDGMTMQVESATGGLEVSQTGTSGWATSLTLNVNKTNIKPTSTVDAETFVALNKYDATDSAKANFVTTTSDVITQTLYLGNSGTSELTIDLRKTFVQDIETAEGANNAKNIADAARIAIFTVIDGDKELVGIMNPYKNSAGTIVDDAETYNGIKSSAVGTDKYVTFGATSGDDLASVETTTTEDLKLTIPAAAADGARGVLQIEVVVWVEGQDAKCINANSGGKFSINLQFNKDDAVLAN